MCLLLPFLHRIPETKKNGDGHSTKQALMHAGKNSLGPGEIRKASFNGPLSSPQITKVTGLCPPLRSPW